MMFTTHLDSWVKVLSHAQKMHSANLVQTLNFPIDTAIDIVIDTDRVLLTMGQGWIYKLNNIF